MRYRRRKQSGQGLVVSSRGKSAISFAYTQREDKCHYRVHQILRKLPLKMARTYLRVLVLRKRRLSEAALWPVSARLRFENWFCQALIDVVQDLVYPLV